MKQDQQSRPWWKDNWPVLALLATAIVIAATGILGYWRSWQRPLWDWLELLIIPLVLALGAFWFNAQTRKSEQELAQRERENDRAIAEERAKEDILQRYLDGMSELVLHENLQESKRDDAVRVIARARTLAVLRSLDGDRKGQVLRFLYEADLIGTVVTEEPEERQVIEAIIDLETADLSGADLWGADLSRANLTRADLSRAILSGADLRHANLSLASLNDTDLSRAILIDAILIDADLSGATLIGAWLTSANLSLANLSLAKLDSTDLSNADLSNADLSGAYMRDAKGCTKEQLAQAASLIGAIFPNGRLMFEEEWEEFKKRHGQSSQAG
jgi:uncharacterized protein YjbI with pentapeptide repeats